MYESRFSNINSYYFICNYVYDNFEDISISVNVVWSYEHLFKNFLKKTLLKEGEDLAVLTLFP